MFGGLPKFYYLPQKKENMKTWNKPYKLLVKKHAVYFQKCYKSHIFAMKKDHLKQITYNESEC